MNQQETINKANEYIKLLLPAANPEQETVPPQLLIDQHPEQVQEIIVVLALEKLRKIVGENLQDIGVVATTISQLHELMSVLGDVYLASDLETVHYYQQLWRMAEQAFSWATIVKRAIERERD